MVGPGRRGRQALPEDRLRHRAHAGRGGDGRRASAARTVRPRAARLRGQAAHSPETIARAEAMKERLLEHPGGRASCPTRCWARPGTRSRSTPAPTRRRPSRWSARWPRSPSAHWGTRRCCRMSIEALERLCSASWTSIGPKLRQLIARTVEGWDATDGIGEDRGADRPRPAVHPHQRHARRRPRRAPALSDHRARWMSVGHSVQGGIVIPPSRLCAVLLLPGVAGAQVAAGIRRAPRGSRRQDARWRARRARRARAGAGLPVASPVAVVLLPHRLQGARRGARDGEAGRPGVSSHDVRAAAAAEPRGVDRHAHRASRAWHR